MNQEQRSCREAIREHGMLLADRLIGLSHTETDSNLYLYSGKLCFFQQVVVDEKNTSLFQKN